jgi:hypothetical protein
MIEMIIKKIKSKRIVGIMMINKIMRKIKIKGKEEEGGINRRKNRKMKIANNYKKKGMIKKKTIGKLDNRSLHSEIKQNKKIMTKHNKNKYKRTNNQTPIGTNNKKNNNQIKNVREAIEQMTTEIEEIIEGMMMKMVEIIGNNKIEIIEREEIEMGDQEMKAMINRMIKDRIRVIIIGREKVMSGTITEMRIEKLDMIEIMVVVVIK